jgi:hypothetical protein
MRRGVLEAGGSEILCWRSSAKGLVRPVVVEAVSEGADEGFVTLSNEERDRRPG